MSKPRHIRGIRDRIPPGYLIGRPGGLGGQAAPQLIDARLFATQAYVKQIAGSGGITGSHGFGFFCGGLPSAAEIIGGGMFPVPMTFTTGDPFTEVASEYPAAGSAVFNINTWVGPQPGTVTQVGTITFSAAGYLGVVAWIGSPYTLPAFTILELQAPNPQDLTLAWITGTINGVAS